MPRLKYDKVLFRLAQILILKRKKKQSFWASSGRGGQLGSTGTKSSQLYFRGLASYQAPKSAVSSASHYSIFNYPTSHPIHPGDTGLEYSQEWCLLGLNLCRVCCSGRDSRFQNQEQK